MTRKFEIQKIMSFAMSVVMLIGLFSEYSSLGVLNVHAQEDLHNNNSDVVSFTEDIGEAGLNGENQPYSITGIVFYGDRNVISLEVSALSGSCLDVSVYEDNTEGNSSGREPLKLAEGKIEITETVSLKYLDVPVSSVLPEYFVVAARLVNEHGIDLCDPVGFYEYTRVYHEYMSATVDDFDEETVISLDDSKDNNFLVLADNVSKINIGESGKNNLTEIDENVYTFSDVSEEIASLNVGDRIIAVGENAQDSHAIEINSIVRQGSDVKLTVNDEPDIANFYSYIKIDTEVDASKEDILDVSTSDVNSVEFNESNQIMRYSTKGEADGEDDEGALLSLNCSVDVIEEAKLNVSAKLNKLRAKVKFNFVPIVQVSISNPIIFNPSEAAISIAYDATINGDIKYDSVVGEQYRPKAVNSLPLKISEGISFPIAAGIKVKTPLYLQLGVDVECEADFSYRTTGEVGFEFDGKKHKIINERGSEYTLNVDGKFKAIEIGYRFSPGVQLGFGTPLGEISVTPALNAYIGYEFAGVMSGNAENPAHLCKSCVDGKVSAIADIWFDVKLKYGIPIPLYSTEGQKQKVLLKRFYASLENDDAEIFKNSPSVGFGRCPNRIPLIDYNEIQPVLINKFDYPDDYDAAIDLYNEKLVLIGYVPKAYSVDGGNKWKKTKPTTFDDKNFPKLLNKGMTLWLSDEDIDKKSKQPPDSANIVKFGTINKRPKAPKLAVNYEIEKNNYEWVLAEKGASQAVTADGGLEVGLISGKTLDANGYGSFFSGAVEELEGSKVKKLKYLARYSPLADETGYTPASKTKKLTVSGELKAPKYKIKTNKKTGDKTLTIKANTSVNGVIYTSKTVIDLNSYKSGDKLSIWSMPTAKKPASATQIITIP